MRFWAAAERATRAVKRATGSRAPKRRRPPYDASTNNTLWVDHVDELAHELRSLESRGVVVIGPASDNRYVRFVRDGSVLVGECSWTAIEGGPAVLEPSVRQDLLEMGWGAPDLGRSDLPSFRASWTPDGGGATSTAFMTKDDARDAAEFAVSTLRGPLAVHQATVVVIRTGSM